MRPSLTLARKIMLSHLLSLRMTVLMPLLALFIVGSAWGLSDAGTDLPMLIEAPTASLLDGAYLVLYVASVFTLLSATIGAVLVSFDSISHGRGSGELEVLLAQPIPRREVANGLILGHWAAITLPTLLLTMLAIIVTARRTGGWPPLWTIALLLIATSLLLLWYVLIQILASSYARDLGAAVTLGVGAWFLFTMLWLLITSVATGLAGLEVGDAAGVESRIFAGRVDLLSPNGVFHHLLEIPLDVQRGVSPLGAWCAALLWTIVPTFLVHRRVSSLSP